MDFPASRAVAKPQAARSGVRALGLFPTDISGPSSLLYFRSFHTHEPLPLQRLEQQTGWGPMLRFPGDTEGLYEGKKTPIKLNQEPWSSEMSWQGT